MSSQSFQQLTPIKTKLGEIDCTAKFSEQFSHLCMNQDYSDVTFVVDGTKLKAHRVIMASRSQYFRALLYGSYMESELNEIPLTVPSLAAFKALLSYIYSGVLSLNKLDNNVVLDILGLANQYDFNELEEAISKYLQQILSIENACPILSSASLYNLESLVNDCHEFMDRNAVNILKDESFLLLSEDSVCGLLKRNSFYAPEVVIYKSIAAWFKNNPKADIKKVLALLRLETMQLSHLLDVVRPSGILEADLILDAIATQNSNEYLNFRGILTVQENVAATRLGARAIKGRNNATLLDGDARTYDLESGYTSHSIDGDVSDNCIEVELGGIYIINHIKLLLWDRDIRSYSYYVEVSIDQKIYKRVVDFSAFYARSWQSLYFPQLPVRFIRIVGTNCSTSKTFNCVVLEAYFVKELPTLVRGLIMPTENIATVEKSAIVIEGVSRTRNNLLNGDWRNYDWDSGYTCHQINSGSILIQLGQPYYLSSCRFLLWDCDNRGYSFYIETSTDQKNWEIAVDRRGTLLRSWQHFTFPARPVVFFRIIGTFNSLNEIFHIVHFECPSQDPEFLKSIDSKASNTSTTTVAESNLLEEF